MKMIITNIQRMCMNDGPGIRTTVFFKGCNLKCPWCCNPENISFEIQQYKRPSGECGVYGINYKENELYEELIKDEYFYKYTGGGITFSGGEPLLHLHKAKNLLRELKKKRLHLAVESALYIPQVYLKQVIDVIDYFMIDIKILDPKLCFEILNGNVDLYYKNLELLKENKKEVVFRIPCCIEYTATDINIKLIAKLLDLYPSNCVELFAVHNLGEAKRNSLGIESRKFEKLSDAQMENLKDKLSKMTKKQVTVKKI